MISPVDEAFLNVRCLSRFFQPKQDGTSSTYTPFDAALPVWAEQRSCLRLLMLGQ